MNKPRFQQIYIEITNICNLHCPFCVETTRAKEYMSVEKFSIIVDRIKEYTHSIYLHVKGEPLIHPEFDKIIELLISKQINTKITTNGLKLASKGDLIINKPNINKINISLQSVLTLDEKRMDEYFQNLHEFVDKIKTTHIYLRNWALNNEESKIIEKYLNKIFPGKTLEDKVLLNDHIHYSVQEKFDWPSINNDKTPSSICLGGKNQLGILVDGSVVMCCLDNNGDTILGNILTDSLEDILNSEKFIKATKEMPYFDLCKKCTYRLKFKNKGGAQ